MSQQTTIRKLAELVNTPVEKLLEQLAEAGMKFSGPDQVVTSTEKVKLLGFLRRSHGKTEQPAESADEAAKKITLNRRKLQEVTVSAGRSKTTVNVEVRQKRTYTKDASGKAMTPDEERADILRKLEESRQRNLDEQRALAEKDRARDEEIARKRQEEIDAKERAEAERKAAEAAAEAAKNAPPAPVAAPRPAASEAPARATRPSAPAPARPAARADDRNSNNNNNRPGAKRDDDGGNRFAGQLHLSAADRARRGNNSNSRGRPTGRTQHGGRVTATSRAVAVVPMVSNVRSHRSCVTSPLATPSPWPTWPRSWP